MNFSYSHFVNSIASIDRYFPVGGRRFSLLETGTKQRKGAERANWVRARLWTPNIQSHQAPNVWTNWARFKICRFDELQPQYWTFCFLLGTRHRHMLKDAILCACFSLENITGHYTNIPTALVRSGLVWSGLVWYGLDWSGLVWSGLAWSGLVWSGLVHILLSLIEKW